MGYAITPVREPTNYLKSGERKNIEQIVSVKNKEKAEGWYTIGIIN